MLPNAENLLRWMHDDHLSVVCWCKEGYDLAIALHLDNRIHRKQLASSEPPQSRSALGSLRDDVKDASVLSVHSPANDLALDLAIEVQLDNLVVAILVWLYLDFLE